jgi:hypothetical protein
MRRHAVALVVVVSTVADSMVGSVEAVFAVVDGAALPSAHSAWALA